MPTRSGAPYWHHERSSAPTIYAAGIRVPWPTVGFRSAQATGWSAATRSAAAHRPGAPALTGLRHLGDGDLLFPRGQVGARREPQATVALPGVLVELHTAVVAVTGVDRPVSAGLAARDRVPDLAVGDRRQFGAGLGADPHDRLAGGRDDVAGHRQATGLDGVDLGHREGHVLGARGARVLDDFLADVHLWVFDAARGRNQWYSRGDLLDPVTGHLDVHAVDHRCCCAGDDLVALFQRRVDAGQQVADPGRGQVHGADHPCVD